MLQCMRAIRQTYLQKIFLSNKRVPRKGADLNGLGYVQEVVVHQFLDAGAVIFQFAGCE